MIRTQMFVMPLLLISLALTTGYENPNTGDRDQLPGGGWSVGFHLYQAEGSDSIPVRVTSITSERNKGLTKVELRNRTSKSVTAVKIGWYVSTEDGPGTILTTGESPLLGLPATLQANESLEFSLPPVSLSKILKPILKGNTLRGDYSIQVAVTEIVYEDESTWKISQPDNLARIKVHYAHAQACGSSCRWNEAAGAFVCVQGLPNERCSIQGDTCTVEACDPGGN